MRWSAAVQKSPVCAPLLRPASSYKRKVGKPAQAGERSSKEPARPRQSTLAPATGHMAGSFMRRVLETNISAIN